MAFKFLKSFLNYQIKHLLGGTSYTNWQTSMTHLYSSTITNKKLAKEIEIISRKRGFLTYEEFLALDQFGKYGYHNTHTHHGMTNAPQRWPEAVLKICQKNNLHQVVEFGSGDGKMGLSICELAEKENYPLSWSGIELLEDLQTQTRKLFSQKKLTKRLKQLTKTIEEIDFDKPCLFVCSYSLDNLLPHVLVNSLDTIAPANTVLGITMQNQTIQEIILTKEKEEEKNISLNDGIFTDSENGKWDTSSWLLRPMQRLYFPLAVLQILKKITQSIPKNSQLLIIDEFRVKESPYLFHFGLPRDLDTFTRDYTDFSNFYKTAGKNLLYFPLYLDSIKNVLEEWGFKNIHAEKEYYMVNFYKTGEKSPQAEKVFTYAILTNPKQEIHIMQTTKYPIPFYLKTSTK